MLPPVRVSDARLDFLVSEDVPYFDLTTHVLGIAGKKGEIEYFTREACVLCGTEEACRIMERLGLSVEWSLPSGARLQAGESFLRASGDASDLHAAWKVCLNLFDHCSAVATKAASMVERVHMVNPSCEVLTTRKSFPGVKDLLIKAILVGGAFPHRMGLSETVLVFDHHIKFLGGFDKFLEELPSIKSRCVEKKLFVESGVEEALALAEAGVDGIQFDKVDSELLALTVRKVRQVAPHVSLVAAGGINPQNAAEYAATGVDGLVTTALYTAKPLDMSVRMSVGE